MRIHYLQHVSFEGLGSIETWAQEHGHGLTPIHLFAGQALPSLADFDWLIVMGGPMGVGDEALYPWLGPEKRLVGEAIAAGKVVLGICLGAQIIAEVLGAKVYPNRHKEIGWFPLTKVSQFPAGAFLPPALEVFHWHGDTFELPAGAEQLARSLGCEQQGFSYQERVVGLQFHLETTPESAATLIEKCGEELAAATGPYIQTPAAMTGQAARFAAINRVMAQLLGQLARVATGVE